MYHENKTLSNRPQCVLVERLVIPPFFGKCGIKLYLLPTTTAFDRILDFAKHTYEQTKVRFLVAAWKYVSSIIISIVAFESQNEWTLPNVSFIIKVIKKVFLSELIATIS